MAVQSGRVVHFPVHPSHRPRLSTSEKATVQAQVRALAAQTRSAAERSYFEPLVSQGLGVGPLTIIGDEREIPLTDIDGFSELEYRLSTLAKGGDLVVIGSHRDRGFERYRRDVLHVGAVRYLDVCQRESYRQQPTSIACLRDAQSYDKLCAAIAAQDATTILAHITTGTIWALARKLAHDIGRNIRVAGPLPTLSALANNKLWFSRVARGLFGPEAVPQDEAVHGVAALTVKIRTLSRKWNKLVVKVPDSAGSAGNFVITREELNGFSAHAVHRFISNLISPVTENAHFPMMVQIWEPDVLTSPSVQVWIPAKDDEPPIVEGVFEQVLTGRSQAFGGAVLAGFSARWQDKLAHQALMLATLFQKLGYFGRCSFDAVIAGESLLSGRLLWIECNARWGGVSVPMTFLNMRYGPAGVPPYAICHAARGALPDRSFARAEGRIDDLLWRPDADRGIVFLTPSGFADAFEMHFLSIGETPADAQWRLQAVLRRLAEPG